MRTRLALFFLLTIIAGACTTSSGGSREPRRDRNRLTVEELAPVEAFTAWDAVQRLRPMWMRPGGDPEFGQPRWALPPGVCGRKPLRVHGIP